MAPADLQVLCTHALLGSELMANPAPQMSSFMEHATPAQTVGVTVIEGWAVVLFGPVALTGVWFEAMVPPQDSEGAQTRLTSTTRLLFHRSPTSLSASSIRCSIRHPATCTASIPTPAHLRWLTLALMGSIS